MDYFKLTPESTQIRVFGQSASLVDKTNDTKTVDKLRQLRAQML